MLNILLSNKYFTNCFYRSTVWKLSRHYFRNFHQCSQLIEKIVDAHWSNEGRNRPYKLTVISSFIGFLSKSCLKFQYTHTHTIFLWSYGQLSSELTLFLALLNSSVKNKLWILWQVLETIS